MTLFFLLLPLYLLGNLHCLGMCGPLVMLLGRHRFKYHYFAGRTLSFTLAATLAATFGTLLQSLQLGAPTTLAIGALIFFTGLGTLKNWHLPFPSVSNSLATLALKDAPTPLFLFGFFTVFLPCGQSLTVFSACALAADPAVGFINGLAFALLTSPSLFFAMKAHALLGRFRSYYPPLFASLSLLIGSLTVLRGLADLGLLPHLRLSDSLHLALY